MSIDTQSNQGRSSELSHQQMLMWTGQHLDPDSPIYNIGFQIDIPTSVDSAAFERAFQHVVSHSDSLRTTIQMNAGQPFRRINDEIVARVPLLDFSGSADPDQHARLWCRAQTRKRYNLDQCLFDTALLRRAEDAYTWYIAHHHLIGDAWAVSQLFRLQSELYSCYQRGIPIAEFEFGNELPPAKDVSPQKKESDPFEVLSVEFYGRKPLRVSPTSDRVTAVARGDRFAKLLAGLTTCTQARSFSKELSQFNVYLTLYFALLHRVSGQQNLCVAAPFHNRLTPNAKNSLGMFIEMHNVLVTVARRDTFHSLLKKVQVATNDYLRRAMSDQLPGRTAPKCNAVFNFIRAEFGEFDSKPVRVEWLHPGCSDRQHHLRLHVEDFTGQDQPEIKFDFNRDLFDQNQQQWSVRHFQQLIEGMSDNWDAKIEEIDILAPAEKQLLLTRFNETPISSTTDVADSFAKVVASNGDRPAITCGSQTATYRELNSQVHLVAGNLAHHRLSRGSRIAICLDRSAHAVVSMLAVLKSGMVFVPLDPDWPQSRIDFVMENCRAECVLTSSDISIAFGDDLPRIDLDAINDPTASISETQPEPSATAYVLYTSGSTGEPKGVMVSRASLAHYINWAADYYGHGEPLTFPLFTPLTFDLSLTSIFVPLITGGQVVVYAGRSDSKGIALLDAVEDNLVDIIKLTPSHLGLLEGRQLKSTSIRQLILGGENLTVDLARKTLSRFPKGTILHNEYGPTEATVGCLVHSLETTGEINGTSVPIGRPITGMRAFVLNDSLQPQPVGVAGRLYVGGTGLAQGYLGEPDVTREKFIDDPFRPGSRLYDTGDIARFNDDGLVEYLGRDDDQVKIRGARVELGAIQTVLAQHDDIAQAVVVARRKQNRTPTCDYCRKCGLASDYPDISFDEQLICNHCRSFETYREKAHAYFSSMDELSAILDTAARQHIKPCNQANSNEVAYDCIALLSGGKDSTYMLARLADLGLKILAFTLDNGYISDQAKANIRRVVDALKVDHQFGSTPAMNEIFVDSLNRHANVCQGCFKTIYTLSMNLGEKNIPFIVTGLSRGQLFETRLTEDLFREPCESIAKIDETVLEARKAYHRVNDAVLRLLDVESLQSEEIFEQVRFLDFYRYCDVELNEMLDYLDKRLPWIRPGDTGRSTNCLINDVGIYVHRRRNGFHNYALPYSWDVRMGHKQRESALAELDDDIDVGNVHRILNEIGFSGDLDESQTGNRLVAFYVSQDEIPTTQLDDHLRQSLPEYMIPHRYVRLDELPISANGKVDLDALPDSTSCDTKSDANFVGPADQTEETLARIWCEVLQVENIGTRDNFFDLGGDSILAIQIVARAHRSGIKITPSQFFESQTIETLARNWSESPEQDQPEPIAQQCLTPIQCWMRDHILKPNDFWNQSIKIHLPDEAVTEKGLKILQRSLVQLTKLHPTLRTNIWEENPRKLPPLEPNEFPLSIVDLNGLDDADISLRIAQSEAELNQVVSVASDTQLGGVLFHIDNRDCRLLLTFNHAAVDAVSIQILIDDLALMFETLMRGDEPAVTHSLTYARWASLLESAVQEPRFSDQHGYWKWTMEAAPPVPQRKLAQRAPTVGQRRERIALLDKKLTKQLQFDVPKSRITIDELLITALAMTLREWSCQETSRVFVERHGREPIQSELHFSGTVGWFTSLSPFRISIPETDSRSVDAMSSTISVVKDRLRSIPDRGIGYGMLRYLHPDSSVRQSLLESTGREVVFNYFGQSNHNGRSPGTAFSQRQRLKLDRSPTIRSFSAIDLNVSLDDQLRCAWDFYDSEITEEDVNQIVDSYLENISALISYCLDEGASYATATDFPLAGLDDQQLKNLAVLLEQNKGGGSRRK